MRLNFSSRNENYKSTSREIKKTVWVGINLLGAVDCILLSNSEISDFFLCRVQPVVHEPTFIVPCVDLTLNSPT